MQAHLAGTISMVSHVDTELIAPIRVRRDFDIGIAALRRSARIAPAHDVRLAAYGCSLFDQLLHQAAVTNRDILASR